MSRAQGRNHKLFTFRNIAQTGRLVKNLLNIYLTKKCLHFPEDGGIIRTTKGYLNFFIFLPLFSLETPAMVWSTVAGVFMLL